jgi:2-oxoglutarate ferredoxin oxidoreductase subunit delta
MSEKRPLGTVTIEAERCKGCEMCIAACPVDALRMSTTRNANGYLLPELVSECTGCTACQMICPDYVFDVYRYKASSRAGAA